jgi:hypothetical protein
VLRQELLSAAQDTGLPNKPAESRESMLLSWRLNAENVIRYSEMNDRILNDQNRLSLEWMACGSLGGGIYTEGRWLWTGLEPIREREVAGVVSRSASQWVGGRHAIHTSMKMVPTEVTETSTLSIHTPGNYPKEENTR